MCPLGGIQQATRPLPRRWYRRPRERLYQQGPGPIPAPATGSRACLLLGFEHHHAVPTEQAGVHMGVPWGNTRVKMRELIP